jgi:pimeloyl-ACP methyl ester carboxylesterase
MIPAASFERHKVRFPSGDTTCAAWHYPGTNGGCVVMAGGTGVTKEPATDRFAPRFQDAGFSVLAIDFRRLGESGGAPRQLVRVAEQLADFEAAIAFARMLPEVDPGRVAIWGFSLAGGHVFRVAAGSRVAAAIAQAPLADGQAIAPNALRHMTPMAALRLNVRAARDVIGRRLGRDAVLVPLAGPRGTVASLTTPDGAKGPQALDPGNRYPDWQQEVAAGSALRLAFYRPGRFASRVECPLLVLAYEGDRSVMARPAIRAGRRAPRGEVVCLPGDHYEAFMDGFEQAVELELRFLRRHLAQDDNAPSTSVAA